MFDEQPDGDPHGECAIEIKRLEGELLALRQAAKEAAVAMAQHMPNRKETHDLYAFLTGDGKAA